MFALRARVFVDWHRDLGREVEVVQPTDAPARQITTALSIDPSAEGSPPADVILPATPLREYRDVEDVAERTREILEYQLRNVSRLGPAAFMAVSELCNNAVEHGANQFGAYIAVRRAAEPQPKVSIAICDLGIGIPEHLRQQQPELSDDGHAIGLATRPGVSGTGDPHRGYGFDAVFDAALTSAMTEARFTILSSRGHFEERIVQERHLPTVYPAAQYRRGAWIVAELISV
jgi:hypothetical protein